MLNQLSHRCVVDQTLQRTASCTNFQKNMTQRREDYGSTLFLLNVQNGHLLLFIFLRSKPMERRKKFNCFFFNLYGWLNFSSKMKKNKGDADFKTKIAFLFQSLFCIFFKFPGLLDVTIMTLSHQLRCHIIWIMQNHFLVFVCVLLMRGKYVFRSTN